MKILNFPAFAAMPEGTIFSFCDPLYGGLHRKAEPSAGFAVAGIDIQGLGTLACQWPLVSVADQSFTVYDPADIMRMVGMLLNEPFWEAQIPILRKLVELNAKSHDGSTQ